MHAAPFRCKTCTRAFQSEEMYRKHIEDKHKPIHLCSTCGKTFWKRSVLVKHAALHTRSGKPHKCPYQQCDKGFTRRELLADHATVNSHTGARPYKCGNCKRSYASHNSYSHHAKCCLKGPKCKVCGKRFSLDSVLADHIKSEHEYKYLLIQSWSHRGQLHKYNNYDQYSIDSTILI